MSIDDRARASARRTASAVAAASNPLTSYNELVALHRHRMRVRVVAGSALLLALVLVVLNGAGSLSRHRAEPIAPRPTVTKPFRAAPPYCGPGSFGRTITDYVAIGGPCPTGPGRYLSAEMGYSTSPPFAFTLPSGWTITGIDGAGGGDPAPALGGIFLRSQVTGAALVLTEYPTQVLASHRLVDTIAPSTKVIARRLADLPFVQPTSVVASRLGFRDAWRVDLVARRGATYPGHCLVGEGCAVTFALGQRAFPGRSYVGLVPGVPSTVYVVGGAGRITFVAWTWGDPDRDQELAGVLAGIDLIPQVVCAPNVYPCGS